MTRRLFASFLFGLTTNFVLLFSGCHTDIGALPTDGGSAGEANGGAAVADMGGAAGSPNESSGGAGSCAVSALFGSRVVSESFGGGQNFGQDNVEGLVLGGPKGGGPTMGGFDVVSLGDGGSITLEFAGTVVDGPGTDFYVFENPFNVGGDAEEPYAELGEVAVSADGETWATFPCTERQYPYGACAGWRPVIANVVEGVGDWSEPSDVGGDAFDLEDVGLDAIRFVRITDVLEHTGTFDLDAVAGLTRCP